MRATVVDKDCEDMKIFSVSQEQRDAQRVAVSWLRGVFGGNNSLNDVISSSTRYLCFIVLIFSLLLPCYIKEFAL